VIRLVVLLYVRFPLSLRNVEDLLFERGIDVCQETVRFWWDRFGPLFAADVGRQGVSRMKGFRHRRAKIVPCCNAGAWQSGPQRDGPLA
jgi:putative transposase